MLQYEPQFGEEAAGRAVDAQQMWHLADDGDAYETFDEPSHHRCGDEGSHPAHTQCAEEQEKDTDQDCEGGSERIEVCRALYRDGAHSQRGDQPCRSVRADDQQARGAEQRVGNQWRDESVEAHDRRHPDDAGISHALRYHDRPDREAGQDIRQQPVAPVARKPPENGQEPLYDGGGTSRAKRGLDHGGGCRRRSWSSSVTRRATVIAR
jgi:hypothetical protein